MVGNHGWKIFIALFILFALNSQAGATGIINLTKGAVYNVQEFDRNGKGGNRHLPSAFWWGEETRKKADKNTAGSGSSVDPASGVLNSDSGAHGVGSSSDYWIYPCDGRFLDHDEPKPELRT